MALLAQLDDLQTCTLALYRPAPQGPGFLYAPTDGFVESDALL